MSDTANTLTEAAAPPPPAAKVRLLGPNNTVYSVDASAASAYEQHGYTRYSGPIIDEGSIEAKFNDWRKAAGESTQAAALGAVNQVPLLDYGLSKVAPDTARDLAEATAEARDKHGAAYATGSVGGALGTFALGGAALKGLGVAGAVASKLPTLAAAAEASPVLAGIAEGAVGSAALNAADQIDSQALEHAITPAGQEKLAFSFGQVAEAATLGAALPGLAGGAASGAGKAARGVQRWARNRLLADFIPEVEQEAMRNVGKGHVLDLARSLTEKGEGSDHVVREVGNRVHSAATSLDELLSHTRDVPMTLEEAKLAHAQAAQHATTSNLIHDDLRPLKEAIDSHENVAKLQQEMNVAQSRLGRAQAIGSGVDKAAAAYDKSVAAFQKAQASVKDLPRDRQLQEMARALYDRVRFRNPTGSEYYEQYLNAGRALADARDTLYLRARPEAAEQFKRVRGELSDHLALAESLSKKHIPAVMEALQKSQSSGAVAGTMALLGLKGGGVISSAATGAGMGMLYYGGMRSVAAASRFVASKLNNADKYLANVIKAGLYGTAASRVALHPYEFQNEAARVLAAQRDPVTTLANTRDALGEHGLPDHVADGVALRAHAVNQAAAQSLPKPPNTPDIASAVQPDTHQQRAWLSETRSRRNPAYALQYPTSQNMAAAKQHYPETIARAQEAVMEALQKNPYMPLASRMYAARILGRPAGGLTSPTFYQSLAQMRAKADADAQQQQGPPARQRGNGPSGVAQSEQTRLGELSTP